jgi:restriction endonuclease Mrr
MADHNNGVQRHQAEVLEQLIENQRLDIEVRRAEVETKSKEIEANERIGLRSIEARKKSRYL